MTSPLLAALAFLSAGVALIALAGLQRRARLSADLAVVAGALIGVLAGVVLASPVAAFLR